MPPDNLTPQMAEDKWNGQKRSEPSVEFGGGFVFTALARRATDCTALAIFMMVISTSEKLRRPPSTAADARRVKLHMFV
jgi:hypothetical protein